MPRCRTAAAGRRHHRARSRRGRRRQLRRRRHRQHHAEQRAAVHRHRLARPAQVLGRGDHGAAAPGGRRRARHHAASAAGAGPADRDPASRARSTNTCCRTSTRRSCANGATRLVERCASSRNWPMSPTTGRTPACRCRSTIDRQTAARYGVTMNAIDQTLYDAFGQRQIATVFGPLTQYHVILEVDPALPQRSRHARQDLRHRRRRRRPAASTSRPAASAAPSARRPRRCRCRPSPGSSDSRRRSLITHQGLFPADHHLVQPGPRRVARPGGRGAAADRAADRTAGLGRRPAWSAPPPNSPARWRARSVLIAGGDRHRLYRARHALRELHPPDHHPVDAAVGRRRRAAGADAVRPGPRPDLADRHRAADRHRQEERHHDGRLRARRRTRGRAWRRSRRSARPASCGSARS